MTEMTATTISKATTQTPAAAPYQWVKIGDSAYGYSNNEGKTWLVYAHEEDDGRWVARIGSHHPDFYTQNIVISPDHPSRDAAQEAALAWLTTHPVPGMDTPEPALSLPGYAWVEKHEGKVSIYATDGGDHWLLWVDSYNDGGHYNAYVGICHPLFNGGPALARGLSTLEDAQKAALAWLKEHPPTAPEPREELKPEPAFSLPGYAWYDTSPSQAIYDTSETAGSWVLYINHDDNDGNYDLSIGCYHPIAKSDKLASLYLATFRTMDDAKAYGMTWLKGCPPVTPVAAETEIEPEYTWEDRPVGCENDLGDFALKDRDEHWIGYIDHWRSDNYAAYPGYQNPWGKDHKVCLEEFASLALAKAYVEAWAARKGEPAPAPEPEFALPGYTWETSVFPDTEMYSADGGERWLLWACTREDGTYSVHVGLHHPLWVAGAKSISKNLPTLDAAKAAGMAWLKDHLPPPAKRETVNAVETKAEPTRYEATIKISISPDPDAPADEVHYSVRVLLTNTVNGQPVEYSTGEETLCVMRDQTIGVVLAEAGRRLLADALCSYLLALPAGAKAHIRTNVTRTRDANKVAREMVSSLGLRVTCTLTGGAEL
jgi:hypothetical protein